MRYRGEQNKKIAIVHLFGHFKEFLGLFHSAKNGVVGWPRQIHIQHVHTARMRARDVSGRKRDWNMRANHSIFPWIIRKAIKNRLFLCFRCSVKHFATHGTKRCFAVRARVRMRFFRWLITLVYFFFLFFKLAMHFYERCKTLATIWIALIHVHCIEKFARRQCISQQCSVFFFLLFSNEVSSQSIFFQTLKQVHL